MKLSCASMGVPECPFVAEGSSHEDVMKMLTEHAMVAHKEKMEAMMKTMTMEDVQKMMMEKMEM